MMDERKKHFVVVHGACHGAWCWYKVAALLRAEGHKVSALDMAASGIHPKRAEEVGSMAEYNQPLTEFMAALPADEKVVLVGHSQGGINISLAMEAFPHNISVAVFVAAFMYGPHLSHRAIKQEDLSLAKLLVRGMPMWRDGNNGDDEEYALSEEKYGSVKRVYVVCGKDKSLKEEYQRWLIQMNPTHEVCVIPHADHMPMFSQPHQLSSCLQLISHKYHHSSSS
ncbi:PREDICTED: methylesterase 3-like isoform X3 [Ipomoea nil]|uniref:methylesterase 3-like isoform X3 n=1 Tax=Ipomoea nil TaxID=35883 RepID=UPI000900A788|nr:PREDICTED: methylesterase 3-like isoform X3 [Ipomoea nil]